VVFYEMNVSEEPPSLAVSGFDGATVSSHQPICTHDGEFGLTSAQMPVHRMRDRMRLVDPRRILRPALIKRWRGSARYAI
jgi:hypothetical protein